ncbi:uncharacterized protein LOC108877609 isoform X1 [Lates calcarifer]|uniref:Uncharacterized protein LOC108877609 isoform X1 n=1 Tax=Lates calcarifer TaxID=8187 RepID=A0AAJ7LJ00_LATCA|nr:uncharacterized protein LOC108877609 isoform X1 [Lates calcarifer]
MVSTIASSYDIPQPIYEVPDVTKPGVTDGSHPEVKVKPVPHPRSKKPKAQNNTYSTLDSEDKTRSATNADSSQHNEHPGDYKRPHPVRPPPKPPSLPSSKPTAAVDSSSQYMSSITESTVKPPAVSAERKQNHPRPERPPLPSAYYDRARSAVGTQSRIYSQGSQQSTISSTQQTAVSPAYSEEAVKSFGTYGETATDGTDRPAVPPRLWQSSLPRPASVGETLPLQTRPKPPPFNPPPPPSTEILWEPVYSEIEHRPYLDLLPDDEDRMTQQRSVPPSQRCQQTTEDKEDIIVMLRWLKRVSKSDYMTPSVYGLTIDEEIRSFNQRAKNVSKALRLYNLLMMKRNDCLRNVITEFTSISDSLDKMQKKTKTMGIAGGTTGAVGGVTAVLGIALAPVTMGTSLIATAVGAGMVASAGGMGAHAAKAKEKVVNRMTVEKLVYEYKSDIVDLEHCLDFILAGMNELRRHDIARLQRAGAQPDALKMAHLSQSVFRNNMSNERRTSLAHTGGMSSERLLLAFIKEMDQYFSDKDGQKLRKSSQSKFSGRVRLLAKNLQDELDHLNHTWEMFS